MNKEALFSVVAVFSLFSVMAFAASSLNSPALCSGQWTNCANAYADNSNRASAKVSSGLTKTGAWGNYGFSLPTSASVDAVTVRADFYSNKPSGYANIRVSGNGGATYGPAHTIGNTTTENSFFIDVTGDLGWTPDMLRNGNLVVQAECFALGGSGNPTCYLDWTPVQVSYTPFDFYVYASPPNASVAQARSANTAVTVSLLGGISQPVNLTSAGCPSTSTCMFNQTSGNPEYLSVFTVTTTPSTPAGTYPINITGIGDGKTRSAQYLLVVTDSTPSASAYPTPTSGTAPLSVNFTGSVAGGDSPISYLWDFRDGTNSTLQNPVHTFTAAGTYNVSFRAIDFDGDASTSYVLVTVNAQCTHAYPLVSITPYVQNGTAGSTRMYVTNVTNMDSSGCGYSVFNMSSTIPAGWTGVFNGSSLAISPGSSALTTFLLTSANSTLGPHNFSNVATNANAPAYAGAAVAWYNLVE